MTVFNEFRRPFIPEKRYPFNIRSIATINIYFDYLISIFIMI